MASSIATSFKTEMLAGTHVAADIYKMLLVKPSPGGTYDATLANIGTPGSGAPSTTNIGTDEVAGTGYTTGGVAMVGYTPGVSGTTVWLDWTTDPSWPSSSISAAWAVIYNSSKSGKVVAVLDLGGTQTDTNGTFTVQLPVAAASTAVVRFA